MPQVVIQLDADTLTALQAGPYYLQVLKAVATNASVALPTLWFQVPPQAFGLNTTVSWDDQYGAYSSTNPAPPSGVIQVPSQTNIGLGETATITNGNVSVGGPGVSGTITIAADATSAQFVAGITQSGDGQMNPIVGLSLPQDGSQVVVTPLEKVLLWFDVTPPGQVFIGQTYTTAPQISVLVDLAGGAAPSVTYNLLNGWGSGQPVGQGQDVVSLLIIPAFGQ